MNEKRCSELCERIANGDLGLDEVEAIYRWALDDDPSESGHAAHIRDTIRDNYEEAAI